MRHSAQPLSDITIVAQWMLANVCLGNNDGHAKNLSLLYGPTGIRLAPIYDVVCTLAYPSIDRTLALALGGAYTLDSITANVLKKCARSLHVGPAHLSELVDAITTGLRDAVDRVCHEIATTVGDTPALGTLRTLVQERCTLLRERSMA
jgi:serine/threonine-protein kinase HipA